MAFKSDSGNRRMTDMNITPLVDVMLVLLIIFMVTMPLPTYPIAVDLPQRAIHPPLIPPAAPVKLTIDANGAIAWNGSDLPTSALANTMTIEAQRYVDPAKRPEIRIEVNKDAQYAALANVLAIAKNAGMNRIAFVDSGQR